MEYSCNVRLTFTLLKAMEDGSGPEGGGIDDAVGFSDGPASPIFPPLSWGFSLVVVAAAATAAPCLSDESIGTKAAACFDTGPEDNGIMVGGSVNSVTCSGFLSSGCIPASMNGLVDG